MTALLSRLSLAAVSVAFLISAHAESAGRAKFDLPSTEWSELVSFEQKLTFNGGQYVLPLYTSAYVLPGGAGNTPKAILIVSSTSGGNRTNVKWISDKCPQARPKYLAVDFGTNQLTDRIECMVVNSDFGPSAFFRSDTQIPDALNERGMQLFKSGYSLRSVVGTKNGTYVRTNLMVQRDFKGLDGVPANATDRQDVPEPLVAWAEAMHLANKSSTQSIRGTL